MKKKIKLSKEEIRKLVELTKKGDKEAKRILWEFFMRKGVAQIKNMIKQKIASGAFTLEEAEIISIVFLSFERALKSMRMDLTEEMNKCFSNYFYLINSYQFIEEYKKITGWKDIKGRNVIIKEERASIFEQKLNSGEKDILKNIQSEILCEDVLNFLVSKNELYRDIVILRMQGFKNKEICNMFGLKSSQLKSRIQYIQTLVKNKFGAKVAKKIID